MATRFIWDHLRHFATVTAYAGAHSPDWTRSLSEDTPIRIG